MSRKLLRNTDLRATLFPVVLSFFQENKAPLEHVTYSNTAATASCVTETESDRYL